MKNTVKTLIIPSYIMGNPSLDCTERVLLAYIAEHPGCSDRQLTEVSHLGLVNVQV